MTRVTRRAVLAAPAMLVAAPARAATDVDVVIVLALDISGSMSPDAVRLQRDGVVAALASRAVTDVIASGPHGQIALAIVEWSGAVDQAVVVPWTIVATADDASAAGARLAAAPIGPRNSTALGAALIACANLITAAPYRALRRVIDVSGDGDSNDGPPSSEGRDAAVARGITVNGLPVAGMMGDALIRHYEDEVVGGPGAFVLPARGLADYAAAMRRKLVMELGGVPATGVVA